MLYINGKWRKTKQEMDVTNPATGEVIHAVSMGGKEETKEAITSAKQAFQTWKKNAW